MLRTFLFLSTLLLTSSTSCDISPEVRIDCGHSGNPDGCTADGCCWVPDHQGLGYPWCFKVGEHKKSCNMQMTPKKPFTEPEIEEMRKYFYANLDIQGSGMVVASPDHNTPGGDYYFAWARDGALSMNAALMTASNVSEVELMMDHWVGWAARMLTETDSNNIPIIVEPKFQIPSGKAYTGGWCRPQTDGPGLRAMTLMNYAKVKTGKVSWSLIKQYLDWITGNYALNGCDLWEEVRSDDFFWNRYTMRTALLLGADFATSVGDASSAAIYLKASQTINATLDKHITSDGYVYESTNRPIDTATIEAFNVAGLGDGVFDPLSDEVTATLKKLTSTFCEVYTVNQEAAQKGTPGVLFGRYPGDGYAGGNPWILLSASAANLLYNQALEVAMGQSITQTSKTHLSSVLGVPLLGGRAELATQLLGAGDSILLRLKDTLSDGMHLPEQMSRTDGTLLGAKDLTWSYANVLKADKARSLAVDAIAKLGEQIII